MVPLLGPKIRVIVRAVLGHFGRNLAIDADGHSDGIKLVLDDWGLVQVDEPDAIPRDFLDDGDIIESTRRVDQVPRPNQRPVALDGDLTAAFTGVVSWALHASTFPESARQTL